MAFTFCVALIVGCADIVVVTDAILEGPAGVLGRGITIQTLGTRIDRAIFVARSINHTIFVDDRVGATTGAIAHIVGAQ